MTQGIIVTSNAGDLAITDQSTNYHYMGSYNAYQTFNGADSFRVGNAFLSFAYYSVTAQNRPIIFVEPSNTNRFAIQAVTLTGTNTWRVLVMYNTAAPRIHAFSTLNTTATAENYGMAVYRANGTLALDSARSPLSLVVNTSFAGSVPPANFSGSSIPDTINNASINLGTLPTRSAFFFLQYGATAATFGISYNLYFYYAALSYRNGNTFNRIWKRSSSATQAANFAQRWTFADTVAKPLFVIDAARFD